MFEALNLQAQKVICRSVRPHLDQHKATGSSRVLKRLPPNKYLHIENFRKIQTTVHAFCNIGIGPPLFLKTFRKQWILIQGRYTFIRIAPWTLVSTPNSLRSYWWKHYNASFSRKKIMHIHPDYILLEMDIIQWTCWLKEFIHLPELVQPNLSCRHFPNSPEIASGAIAVQAAAAAKDSSREGPRATPELRGRGVASGYPLWHIIFWRLHRDRMRSVYQNWKHG